MQKYLVLLIPFLLLSCMEYKLEIRRELEAKVVGQANTTLGLQFEICDREILLDILNLSVAEMAYFSKMKKIPLLVVVKASDSLTDRPVIITFYHRNAIFGSSKGYGLDIPLRELMNRHMEIPDFVWYMYDSEDYDDGITPQELMAKFKKEDKELPAITVKEGDKSL